MLLGYIMISARSEEEGGPERQKERLVYLVCASRCQRLCIIIILNFNNVSFKLISSLLSPTVCVVRQFPTPGQLT